MTWKLELADLQLDTDSLMSIEWSIGETEHVVITDYRNEDTDECLKIETVYLVSAASESDPDPLTYDDLQDALSSGDEISYAVESYTYAQLWANGTRYAHENFDTAIIGESVYSDPREALNAARKRAERRSDLLAHGHSDRYLNATRDDLIGTIPVGL